MTIMISPGDLVTPCLRFGINSLCIWKDAVSPELVDEINKKEILMVLQVVDRMQMQQDFVQDEWKNGAVQVLSANGKVGWTGIGWLKKLPSSSHTKNKSVRD